MSMGNFVIPVFRYQYRRIPNTSIEKKLVFWKPYTKIDQFRRSNFQFWYFWTHQNFMYFSDSWYMKLSLHIGHFWYPQRGKFRNFLPLIFYVKSILKILAVQNLPFFQNSKWQFLELLESKNWFHVKNGKNFSHFNTVNLKFSITNFTKYLIGRSTCFGKINFEYSSNFWNFWNPKIDFT